MHSLSLGQSNATPEGIIGFFLDDRQHYDHDVTIHHATNNTLSTATVNLLVFIEKLLDECYHGL